MKLYDRKNIRIEGVGFHNLGAALMLFSILSQIGKRGHRPVVGGPKFRHFEDYRFNISNVYKEFIWKKYRLFDLASLVSSNRLYDLGLVKRKDISLVLNASGFSLGDQWVGSYSLQSNKKYVDVLKSYKKNGAKIVYLPQACGPFESDLARDRISRSSKYIDLFYARDEFSYNCIKCFFPPSKVKLCNDFTIPFLLDENRNNKSCDPIKKKKVVIVPNEKMKTHQSDFLYNKYISFLCEFIKKYRNDWNIEFLIHGGPEDKVIADEINNNLTGTELSCIENLSCIDAKKKLKDAFFVISSRYHALVSALSWGVPCVSLGWSHKYFYLMKDFGIEDLFLDLEKQSFADLEKLFKNVVNSRIDFAKQICLKRDDLVLRIDAMWKKVFSLI